MQEYRKKMEEQKRLREKLLREKENRRKMAAIEKQNEDAKTDSNIAAGKLYFISVYHIYTIISRINAFLICYQFVTIRPIFFSKFGREYTARNEACINTDGICKRQRR